MSEKPHGVFESVFKAIPDGRPYLDGRYAIVCKVCGGEGGHHEADCAYAAVRSARGGVGDGESRLACQLLEERVVQTRRTTQRYRPRVV